MIEISAFAKINWTLDICGRRADGYHLLDSVMQSVSLCDTVTLEKDRGFSVSCSVTELAGENNIAAVAAETFFRETGILGGVKIRIEKQIPLAAGLGGGSADAAAVLVGLNHLYETNLSAAQLCEIGVTVGADVPFCIVGGTARVGGIGEKIEPLPTVEPLDLLLIKNGVKPSTGEMYRRLDAEKTPPAVTDAAVNAIRRGDTESFLQNLGNAFERVSGLFGVPELLSGKPITIGLSGSGPTVFAVFLPEQAASEEERLKKQGIEVYRCRPVSAGVKILV